MAVSDPLLRARMAHLTTALARSLSTSRRRAEAQELLAQERRLEGGAAIKAPLCEARLKQARQAEDEALDELGRAWTGAIRFVTEGGGRP